MSIQSVALVIMVTFFWALCYPLIEIGHRATPPLFFAGLRAFLAGLALLLPLLVFKGRDFLRFSLWRDAFFIGVAYTTFGYGGMFLADGRVDPGIATVLGNTQPILAAAIAFFTLAERPPKLRILGLFLGFAGILIIVFTGTNAQLDENLNGMTFVLIGALGVASANVLISKLSPKHDALPLTALQLILGSMFLFLISVTFENEAHTNWHWQFTAVLGALAITTVIAESVWIYLLKRVELTKINNFTFLTPAFGLAIGIFFFGEKLSLMETVGVLVIATGIYLTIRSDEGRTSASLKRNDEISTGNKFLKENGI